MAVSMPPLTGTSTGAGLDDDGPGVQGVVDVPIGFDEDLGLARGRRLARFRTGRRGTLAVADDVLGLVATEDEGRTVILGVNKPFPSLRGIQVGAEPPL